MRNINKNEIWVPIENYVGLYEVSSFGRVRSLNYNHTHKKKILSYSKNKNGYLQVNLYKNNIRKTFLVHRLVATAFLPNWFCEEQVNHKDENKHNNNVNNLEWCSSKYNTNYGTAIKRKSEKQINKNKSKIVLQYTSFGEFIKEYPSLSEVNRQLGFPICSISQCCLGKTKQSHGFIWKYKVG